MILLNRRKYIHRRRPQGAPADLADAVVTLASETVYYTGNPVYPSVSVTYEGAALIVNTDYTLNYTDNTNIGAATVTVTGMGEYTGSVVKTFQIVSAAPGAGWSFDISKTADTPDAIYEVADFGGDSPRLAVFDGGFVSIPGRLSAFNRYELPSLEHTSSGGLTNATAGLTPDGIHFVFVNGSSNNVFAASASTPYDVSNLSFAAQGVYATTSACRNLVISGDGFHVFMIGMWDYGLQGKIYRHDLSSAFDFSTMSAAHSATISFVGPATSGKYQDFCFAPDGRKMLWFDNATAYVYDLSVAWDPSTATLSKSKTFPAGITAPAVAVDAAGENLYIGGGGSLRVYSLTT